MECLLSLFVFLNKVKTVTGCRTRKYQSRLYPHLFSASGNEIRPTIFNQKLMDMYNRLKSEMVEGTIFLGRKNSQCTLFFFSKPKIKLFQRCSFSFLNKKWEPNLLYLIIFLHGNKKFYTNSTTCASMHTKFIFTAR